MKLSWPHGKDLMGAATGFRAEGCSASACAMRTAVHVNKRLDIVVRGGKFLTSRKQGIASDGSDEQYDDGDKNTRRNCSIVQW